MSYTAVIEIPKGGKRRIHMAYDKSGFVDLGPISERIQANGGAMPVHYGYIEGTKNHSEGDEIDVMLVSNRLFETGDRVEIEPIEIWERSDGDHKILALEEGRDIEGDSPMTPEERRIALEFFGFAHEIVSVGGKERAIEFIREGR